ncbi:hypothetical protein JYK22_31950, partial [Nonomuraea sp. RK-328]|nr:hypothetical protein [Nonomuraea sp. RK-328]
LPPENRDRGRPEKRRVRWNASRVPEKRAAVITKIANSVVAFRNAVRTGVGAEEAVAGLESAEGLERATVLGLEGQAAAESRLALTQPEPVRSFTVGHVKVLALMAEDVARSADAG